MPMPDEARIWYVDQAEQFRGLESSMKLASAMGTVQGVLSVECLSDSDKVERIRFFLNEMDKGGNENAVYA